MNGDPKTPLINGLYNTINTYRESMKFVEFSKPTLLETLLQRIITEAESS